MASAGGVTDLQRGRVSRPSSSRVGHRTPAWTNSSCTEVRESTYNARSGAQSDGRRGVEKIDPTTIRTTVAVVHSGTPVFGERMT